MYLCYPGTDAFDTFMAKMTSSDSVFSEEKDLQRQPFYSGFHSAQIFALNKLNVTTKALTTLPIDDSLSPEFCATSIMRLKFLSRFVTRS